MTAAPLVPEIRVDDRASQDDIRSFFERDRLLSAYALADLDRANIDTARWWVARRERDVVAAALLVDGRSNRSKGVILIGLYVAIAIVFFVVGDR